MVPSDHIVNPGCGYQFSAISNFAPCCLYPLLPPSPRSLPCTAVMLSQLTWVLPFVCSPAAPSSQSGHGTLGVHPHLLHGGHPSPCRDSSRLMQSAPHLDLPCCLPNIPGTLLGGFQLCPLPGPVLLEVSTWLTPSPPQVLDQRSPSQSAVPWPPYSTTPVHL